MSDGAEAENVVMTKTRFVLKKDFEYTKCTTFEYESESDEEVRHSSVDLDKDVWIDMGKPETITVTVEPGDLLNDGAGESAD